MSDFWHGDGFVSLLPNCDPGCMGCSLIRASVTEFGSILRVKRLFIARHMPTDASPVEFSRKRPPVVDLFSPKGAKLVRCPPFHAPLAHPNHVHFEKKCEDNG